MKPWPHRSDSNEGRTAMRAEFVVLVLILNVALIGMLALFASRAGADVPIVPSGRSFICTPTAVWDGDGPIWCAEGPRVRLNAIAARELDGSCRQGHPCPRASGIAARDHLVSLLGHRVGRLRHGHITVNGPPLRCYSTGSAGGERTAARCVSRQYGDVGCRMVRDGFALEWRRYGEACPDRY